MAFEVPKSFLDLHAHAVCVDDDPRGIGKRGHKQPRLASCSSTLAVRCALPRSAGAPELFASLGLGLGRKHDAKLVGVLLAHEQSAKIAWSTGGKSVHFRQSYPALVESDC